MNIDINKFNNDGFVLIKNVFSKEEINNLRSLSKKTLELDKEKGYAKYDDSDQKSVYYTIGDLLIKPLRTLLMDKRIIKIATKIIGEKPVYFGESNYQVGVGDRGFYRDSVDEVLNGKSTREHGVGPDWSDEYKIIRIGVYLQDHHKFSGGVKFEKGSHKLPFNKGARVLADTRAGDVVVWDLRTYHSGNSVRLKVFPNLPMGCRIENILPEFLIRKEQSLRMSCFMVFGKESKYLDRHIEKHYKIKFKEYMKIQKYSDDILKKCKDSNFKVIIP